MSQDDSAAAALQQQVSRLIRSGDLRGAEAVANELLTRFPGYGPGWHAASFLALSQGEVDRAAQLIHRALSAAPDDPRYLLQHARVLSAQRRQAQAVAATAQAEAAAAADPALLDAIGSHYNTMGEHEHALRAYSSAVTLAPDNPLYWFNRATVQRFLGRLAAAESDYDRVIALRKDDHEAYINRSELRRQTPQRNHVAALEQLLQRPPASWRGRVQLHYALAKEHEDLGHHALSWQHLEQGARLRRQHLRYDVAYDVDTVTWIMDAFPSVPDGPRVTSPAAAPIFVVGLPRSGTTLVERILGSHSQVHAAGELNDFAAALVAAAVRRAGGRALPRPELITATRDLDFGALGVDYLQRTAHLSGGAARFTDKMPLNYLYCGLIARALPGVRIVHVTRNPMASCYAMYKTLFKDGYPFSYDLAETGRYYLAYRRLMQHWHTSMPGVIHEISYERLVREQESQTRALLQACDLQWEEGCLQFHRNPTATTTASASQVRQPLYDSSLAQWRHYYEQLSGLRQQLLAGGIPESELQA